MCRCIVSYRKCSSFQEVETNTKTKNPRLSCSDSVCVSVSADRSRGWGGGVGILHCNVYLCMTAELLLSVRWILYVCCCMYQEDDMFAGNCQEYITHAGVCQGDDV